MQTKEKITHLEKKKLLEDDSVILGVLRIIWKDMCDLWKSMVFAVITVLIFTSSWCLFGKKVLGYSVCVSCF